MAQTEEHVRLATAVSRLVGWIYVACWSASFYPQPFLNWQRKSVTGCAIDFPTLNVLGFISYALSNTALLFSPLIRQQYGQRHPISPEPTVRLNDVAFAAHAVVLSTLTYSQFWPGIWGFKVGRFQRTSRSVIGIFWGCLVAVLMVVLVVLYGGGGGGTDAQKWAWIDVVYAFGFIKLLVTFIKYIPQAWLNYKRKSTQGWDITQIILDFVGGVLSIVQLLIDASMQSDWSGLIGNPVKFALGNVSIFFDLVFITQHYILYPHAKGEAVSKAQDVAEEPLLSADLLSAA